jgi:hypothetical protein
MAKCMGLDPSSNREGRTDQLDSQMGENECRPIVLSEAAFRRFWFRDLEFAPEGQLRECAKAGPSADAAVWALREVDRDAAEYWPMLLEECRRE